mgnify:CR=1 FL=1
MGICVAGKVPARKWQNCNHMPHSFYIYLGTNVSPQTKRLQELYSWAEFYRAKGIAWRDGRNILQELEDEIDELKAKRKR